MSVALLASVLSAVAAAAVAIFLRPSGANRCRQARPVRQGRHRRRRRSPRGTGGRLGFPFPAGPTRKSHRARPVSVATSDLPTVWTPRSGENSTTPCSCWSAPSAPRTGWAKRSIPGTARVGHRRTTPPTRSVKPHHSSCRPPRGATPPHQSDLQTFYVVGSTANLVFHAEAASELWFPTSKIYVSDDGTIVSPIGLGKGAIYSVESQVVAPTPAQLQSDSSGATLPTPMEDSYLQLPHAYPRGRSTGQVDHRRRPHDLCPGRVAYRLDRHAYPLLPRYPAPAAGRRHRQ